MAAVKVKRSIVSGILLRRSAIAQIFFPVPSNRN